jgi:hypothetical protein
MSGLFWLAIYFQAVDLAFLVGVFLPHALWKKMWKKSAK